LFWAYFSIIFIEGDTNENFDLAIIKFLITALDIDPSTVETNYTLAHWDYNGERIYFRSDLRESDEVSLYPNKLQIRDLVLNSQITEVKIIYKETADPDWIAMGSMEITAKLGLLYENLGREVEFSLESVETI